MFLLLATAYTLSLSLCVSLYPSLSGPSFLFVEIEGECAEWAWQHSFQINCITLHFCFVLVSETKQKGQQEAAGGRDTHDCHTDEYECDYIGVGLDTQISDK